MLCILKAKNRGITRRRIFMLLTTNDLPFSCKAGSSSCIIIKSLFFGSPTNGFKTTYFFARTMTKNSTSNFSTNKCIYLYYTKYALFLLYDTTYLTGFYHQVPTYLNKYFAQLMILYLNLIEIKSILSSFCDCSYRTGYLIDI